jgi:hypothetical protein
VVRNSQLSGNSAYYAAGAIQLSGGTLVMEGSRLSGNVAGGEYADGGALELVDSTATIARSTISGNSANDGGGLFASGGRVSLTDSTIADNHVGSYTASGGDIAGSGLLVVRNSTITGNTIPYGYSSGGIDGVQLDIANSIVAGNQGGGHAPDIASAITLSNGHNVFGTDVAGNIAGDRENVAPGAIFAALDPNTGGGLLGPNGTVALRNSVTNPALSGADSLLVQGVDQLGAARFQPGPSRADTGAVERNQTALSTIASATTTCSPATPTPTRSPPWPATTSWSASPGPTRSTAATAPTCSTAAPATTSSTAAPGWTSRSTRAAPPWCLT